MRYPRQSTLKNLFCLKASFQLCVHIYLPQRKGCIAHKYFYDENSTFMVHPDIYNVTHEHWHKIISEKIDLWRQDIENTDIFF